MARYPLQIHIHHCTQESGVLAFNVKTLFNHCHPNSTCNSPFIWEMRNTCILVFWLSCCDSVFAHTTTMAPLAQSLSCINSSLSRKQSQYYSNNCSPCGCWGLPLPSKHRVKVGNKDEGKRKNKNKKWTSWTRATEVVWGTFPFKLVWYVSDTFFPSLPTPIFISGSVVYMFYFICMILKPSLSLYSDLATVTSSYITPCLFHVCNQLFTSPVTFSPPDSQ